MLDIRELFEDLVVQVVPVYGQSMHVRVRHVDEVACLLVNHIVVTNQVLVLVYQQGFVKGLVRIPRVGIDCDAIRAFPQKVHLTDLLVLVVDYAVSLVLISKYAGHKPLGEE